eukprot:TRINITY_DN3261_c0_g1_i1.p1 TRINITY_DN3261_c0_g1~~TRINITY_DN3261_c0_g1_i1.p1  ORF type:complete len:218 (-),score=7.43 TRINITY_DN3261_c0_g1_i1:69-722(-)
MPESHQDITKDDSYIVAYQLIDLAEGTSLTEDYAMSTAVETKSFYGTKNLSFNSTYQTRSGISPRNSRQTRSLITLCSDILEDTLGLSHFLQYHLLKSLDTRYISFIGDVYAFRVEGDTLSRRKALSTLMHLKYLQPDSNSFIDVPAAVLAADGHNHKDEDECPCLDTPKPNSYDHVYSYLIDHLCRTTFSGFLSHKLFRMYTQKRAGRSNFVEVEL